MLTTEWAIAVTGDVAFLEVRYLPHPGFSHVPNLTPLVLVRVPQHCICHHVFFFPSLCTDRCNLDHCICYLFAVYNSSHAVKSISFQESERSAIKELLQGTCLLDTLPEYTCVRSSTIGAYHLQCHMLLLACIAGPHAQLPELSRSTQLLC